MSVEALNEALGVDADHDQTITVADPDIIRSWSKGEVKTRKPLLIEHSSPSLVDYLSKDFWTSSRLRMCMWKIQKN